jgi:hypothetical protein
MHHYENNIYIYTREDAEYSTAKAAAAAAAFTKKQGAKRWDAISSSTDRRRTCCSLALCNCVWLVYRTIQIWEDEGLVVVVEYKSITDTTEQ